MFEEKLKPRERGIDCDAGGTFFNHIKLKEAKVLGGGGIGRMTEVACKLLDSAKIHHLGLWTELSQRHVIDHALS